MSDILEAIGEPLYYDTERKLDFSLTGSTLLGETITHKSLTIGEYELIKPGSVFTKSGIKPPKPLVYVEDDSLIVSSQQLEISMPYPIRFENKRYVVVKPKEGVIDLYELLD